MTKNVRVENADTSSYKVRVRVYDMMGTEPDPQADVLVHDKELPYPTNVETFGITSSRYCVVTEVKP